MVGVSQSQSFPWMGEEARQYQSSDGAPALLGLFARPPIGQGQILKDCSAVMIQQ